jgi:hypothetical protein
MNVSRRELRLLGFTLLLLLGGLSYWLVSKQLVRLREASQQEVTWQLQVMRNQRELMRRGDLARDLEIIREQLPRHAEGRDVKSELSQQIERLAAQAGLELTGLTPEKEEPLADIGLHQLTIKCAWRGTPEALVGFMVGMQQLGPVMDIEDLNVKTSAGRPGEALSGTFLVACAFSRVPVPPAEPLSPSPTGPVTPVDPVPAAPGPTP